MSKWLPNEENDIRLKEHIGSFNLQSSSQLSTIAEVFAEAKCFFCIYLGNIFAEVITIKQNVFISAKLF